MNQFRYLGSNRKKATMLGMKSMMKKINHPHIFCPSLGGKRLKNKTRKSIEWSIAQTNPVRLAINSLFFGMSVSGYGWCDPQEIYFFDDQGWEKNFVRKSPNVKDQRRP